MNSFVERARASEGAFARREDLAFRVRTRRDRALGSWAAGTLGRTGEAAELYAEALVAAGIAGGDAAVAAKLSEDLDRPGSTFTEAEIRARMDEALAAASAATRDR